MISLKNPPHAHWFAIELINLLDHEFDVNSTVRANGVNVTVNMESLECMYNSLLAIENIEDDRSTVYLKSFHEKLEATSTAILATSLDRFLFSDEHVLGACYHQLPSRRFENKSGSGERPVVYVLSTKTGLPSFPVLAGDFKGYNPWFNVKLYFSKKTLIINF